VQLLMHHLSITRGCRPATLLIHPDNVRSRALANRARFERRADLDGNAHYKRTVPPLTDRDGAVSIRRRHRSDLEMDLAGRDGEHIRWLWQPSEADQWKAMTPTERRRHALEWLAGVSDSFGSGPRWTFAVGLALQFLRHHTGTRRAHVLVDPDTRDHSPSPPPSARPSGP
jgi:hypothetical protein